MKNSILVITLTVIIALVSPLNVHAEIMAVDPDTFDNGTDISNAFEGVSLSSIGGASSGSVFSRTDGQATTGLRTFGNNTTNGVIPDLVWFQGNGLDGLASTTGSILRVDFDSLTDFVSIEIINQDSFDGGVLRAFDSNNIEIDSSTSSISGASAVLSISASSATIAYVTVAGNSAQDSVHLDNLQFNKLTATDPNFDTSTGIVTFPRVTVDGETAFLNVELLLRSDGTYAILSAEAE